MEELAISSLSSEQTEKICEVGEEAARRYVTSKIPSRQISDLSIAVNLNGADVVNIEVDVEVTLSPVPKDVNVKKLAEESVQAAFEAIEKYLEDSGCRFNR